MIRALTTAAGGLKAQQTNMDIISNNLANINTSGYKKVRAEFKDVAYEVLKSDVADGKETSERVEVGLGCELSTTTRIFSQGSLIQTSNPLDLSIDGKGFFKVKDFDGSIKYTRDGSFKIDADGKIVTSSGRPIEPEIIIPPDSKEITISSTGVVSVILSGDSKPLEVGRIELVVFANPNGLKAIGDNLYQESSNSGIPVDVSPGLDGAGIIKQGFLESSNVEVVEEMVKMIMAQRAFEINSKAMEAADDMLKIVNNIRP